MKPPLQLDYDLASDTLTVDKLKFSGDFFRFFNGENEGKHFRFVSIKDGVITVSVEPPLPVPALLDLKKPAP